MYEAKVHDGILFVNPGHLKKEDKKGFPPTFAILDIEDRKVTVRILDLKNKTKLEERFEL